MTRIKLILALALATATAGGYLAFAQRNYNGNDYGGGGRNNFGRGNNGDYSGFGGRNNFGGAGFGGRNNGGYYSSAQATNVPGPTEYPKFSQYIADRNIFDPTRFAPSIRPINQGNNNRPPPPSATFGLVGTMAYEKGMFAFFDGNSPQYQMVLYASDNSRIAGFIVANVTPSSVTLQTADKTQSMTLKIGDSLRQQQDGTWELGGSIGSFSGGGGGGYRTSYSMGSSAAGSSGSMSAASVPAAAPAPSAAVQGNEILRRLMQERQQQLK